MKKNPPPFNHIIQNTLLQSTQLLNIIQELTVNKPAYHEDKPTIKATIKAFSTNIKINKNKTFEIKEKRTLIGSGPFNNIILKSPHASFIHALLMHDEANDSFTLYDLGSHTGIFFEHKKIHTLQLHHNDVFTIAETRFKLVHTKT